MSTSSKTVKPGTLSHAESLRGILIIASLFFIFGFVSWINAILIPYFRIGFELSHFDSYLVAFAFYISYLVFSVPASFLLKRIGFKKGMMVGFWAMALGALLFIPAANAMLYEVFLLGLFSIGAGLAVLQTAANPYVTILGPQERGAQRQSIMGICNKGAGILAPLIFAAVIFRPTDAALFEQLKSMTGLAKEQALAALIGRVIVPYTCVGIALIVLGLFIRFSPLPDIDTEHETEEVAQVNSGKTSIFQFPHLILGALAWFLHVGTQVISIDTVITYAGSMGINLMEAKVLPSYILTCSIIGYVIGVICIPRFISQANAMKVCAMLGVSLTLMIIYSHGQVVLLGHTADVSLWFVVLLGLANSLIGPAIWPLALDGLGRFTKIGSSVIVMGLSGNAVLPMIYGHFADILNERSAYWVLMPCYLYILFYAWAGHRIRRWK
jgi:FHS family L-fucose permease-like MFS transporter